MNLSPSIFAGAINLIAGSKDLKMRNNSNYKAAPFASIDKCVAFLKSIDIHESEIAKKESEKNGLAISHYILLKYLTKNPMSDNWHLTFNTSLKSFNNYINDGMNYREAGVNQVLQNYVINNLNQLDNEKERECIEEIKKLYSLNIYADSKASRDKKLDIGNKGEKLSRKYEKLNSNILKIEDTSLENDGAGYDLMCKYANGLEKAIEVKTSSLPMKDAIASISFWQWRKANLMKNIEYKEFEFHFWLLSKEDGFMLAILNCEDMLHAVPEIKVDIESKAHWDKFNIPFLNFEDKFFSPFKLKD